MKKTKEDKLLDVLVSAENEVDAQYAHIEATGKRGLSADEDPGFWLSIDAAMNARMRLRDYRHSHGRG